MLLSRACEYGLRAALYLAATADSAYVPIRTVSDALGIPYPFLAKIVQTLGQHGVLASSRGPNGGIALARPAAQIPLREIVVAIDGEGVFTECVLGLPGCGEQKPCPLHERWGPTRAQLDQMFDDVTLEDLAARIRSTEFRIATLLPAS